jgi:hypothetical protein
MAGAGAITNTTIPRAAITGTATIGMTADIGATTIGMTADTATTVEIGGTDEGAGDNGKRDRAPCPLLSSRERGIGVSGCMGNFEGLEP